PAAALIMTGLPLPEVGPPVTDPVLWAATQPVRTGDAIVGSVGHVDRFGRLITDIPVAPVRNRDIESAGGTTIPVLTPYAHVPPGSAIALVGSRGFVEVSIRDGSAAVVLGTGRGASVKWRPMAAAAK